MEKQKSELEKCLAGELYDCHDPAFLARKARATAWMQAYNALAYSEREKRYAMLLDLFGRVGTNVSVADGFICGFGDNFFIGDNVSINYRCMFIDCNTITIGNDVLIAPGVQLQTAAHPVELAERLTPGWKPGDLEYRWRTYARPIVIGDGCWIGANVTVLPGVTIGRGSVIGAGSVVNKDIPPTVSPSESPAESSGRSMNMPVPCRVIRRINEYAHPLPGHPEDQ